MPRSVDLTKSLYSPLDVFFFICTISIYSLVSSLYVQFSAIDELELIVTFISAGGGITANEKTPVGTHN